MLDVGAGSGRDSAWLAARGADVVAVEPSAAMREEALSYHPDVSIRWIDDVLPSLASTSRLGLSFDLILLSAVWQHVEPSDRPRALRKLVTLLKPGGLLILTLRLGECDPDRVMHPVSVEEVERLAREQGLAIVRRTTGPTNSGGRRLDGLVWRCACLMTAPVRCRCCGM